MFFKVKISFIFVQICSLDMADLVLLKVAVTILTFASEKYRLTSVGWKFHRGIKNSELSDIKLVCLNSDF